MVASCQLNNSPKLDEPTGSPPPRLSHKMCDVNAALFNGRSPGSRGQLCYHDNRCDIRRTAAVPRPIDRLSFLPSVGQ